jgi:hypothetical protein
MFPVARAAAKLNCEPGANCGCCFLLQDLNSQLSGNDRLPSGFRRRVAVTLRHYCIARLKRGMTSVATARTCSTSYL